MRLAQSHRAAGMLLLATVLAATVVGPATGAVATRRLGTGLAPVETAGALPQAWAAPVQKAPRLDGRLDEAAWKAAEPVVMGPLQRPGKVSPRTEARFLRCDGVLYVGVVLEEPNVGDLKRKATGRDGPAWEDDSIELFLSPDPQQGYYQFVFGAGGGVFDRVGHGDPAAWNSAARSAVAVDEKQWSIEIAVPLESLGAGNTVPERWRANVYRNRQAGTGGQNQAWSPTLRPDYDVPERFGHLLMTAASPRAERAEVERLSGITVEELDSGQAVLVFDLTDLPKGTKVYRARLRCSRSIDGSDPRVLEPVELLPLTAYEPGTPPRPAGEPLKLVPPWCRSFDVTVLVGRLAGTNIGGVLVRSFPGWQPSKTFLDVMYEGTPGEVPKPASCLSVLHRAGQTLITWQEVEPLLTAENATWGEIRQALARGEDACRYRIYVHDRPIDARSIAEAELVAEVEPLSGYNTGGRNMEYLIGEALVEPDEMGELGRDYNGYMYTWGMDSQRMNRYPVSRFVIRPDGGPLPPGAGLYVHSPASPGRRYYAVVSCRRGVENTVDFAPGNSLAQAVEETVGPGEPVHQGPGLWGPYFDYPGRRQVYVQWCAPPLAPLPNMAFNWSVLVPPTVEEGQKSPVELYFHAGNFSYAKPRKKFIRDSIQIAPHDYPFSGWYGFHEAWGTLRSWRDGTVGNHTQRRILAFLDWAQDEFPLDPDRILLYGHDGAAVLAMDHREVFAYAMIAGFEGSGDRYGRILDPDAAPRFARAWGPKSPHIADRAGRSDWGWAMLDKLALERPEVSMPLMDCAGGSWGGKRGYGKAFGPFYDNMQKTRQPLIAGFGWDATLITPQWYTGLWQPRKHHDDAAPLDITRTTAVPAFANASTSREALQSGNINWAHTWRDVRDEPDRFAITLFGPGTLDMTPRRLQRLTLRPGERLHWRTEPIPDRRDPEPKPQSGTVTVDQSGLFTIPALHIPSGGVKVQVTRGK